MELKKFITICKRYVNQLHNSNGKLKVSCIVSNSNKKFCKIEINDNTYFCHYYIATNTFKFNDKIFDYSQSKRKMHFLKNNLFFIETNELMELRNILNEEINVRSI